MGANFTPTFSNPEPLQPFKFWCQTALPTVYDDALSYYELLNKVVYQLNETMQHVNSLGGDVSAMLTAYNQLQNYVNEYFANLDVSTEINTKLDEMVTNGTLSELLEPFVTAKLPNVVSSQISDVVASQINPVVNSQMQTALNDNFNDPYNTALPTAVTTWLNANVEPAGSAVAVDKSLAIGGNAADSKVVGDFVQRSSAFVPMLLSSSRVAGNNTFIYDGSSSVNATIEDATVEMKPNFTATSGILAYGKRVDTAYQLTSLSNGDKVTIGIDVRLKTETPTTLLIYFSTDANWATTANYLSATITVPCSGYYPVEMTYTMNNSSNTKALSCMLIRNSGTPTVLNITSIVFYPRAVENIDNTDYTKISASNTYPIGVMFTGAYHEVYRYTSGGTQSNKGYNGNLGHKACWINPASLINTEAESGNYSNFFELATPITQPNSHTLPFSVMVIPKAEYSNDEIPFTCGFTTTTAYNETSNNLLHSVTFTVKGITINGKTEAFNSQDATGFNYFYIRTNRDNMNKIESVYVCLGEWGKMLAKEKQFAPKYNLVCWGDSLTAGAGGGGTTYGTVINSVFPNAKIYNGGVGGDRPSQVVFRSGADCFYIPANVNPSNPFTPTTPDGLCEAPYNIPPFTNSTSFNVIVEGVTYTATKDTSETLHISGLNTTKTYPRSVRIAETIKGDVTIIWCGTNGSRLYDAIYPKVDAIISSLENNNYIVIGILADTDSVEGANASLQERYGAHFLDLKPLIVNYGLAMAGITPTTQDNTDIANGDVPTSLMASGSRLHFNSTGYTVIGNFIVDKLRGMGYDEYLK